MYKPLLWDHSKHCLNSCELRKFLWVSTVQILWLRPCFKRLSIQKVLYFPLRNFRLLYYPGIRFGYNNLVLNVRSIICQVVTYGRLKTKQNFKLLAQKVVVLAYEKWSLTRGSKYSYLTWQPLVIWRTGRNRTAISWQREAFCPDLKVITTYRPFFVFVFTVFWS